MPAPSVTHTNCIIQIADHISSKWGISRNLILGDVPKKIGSVRTNVPKIGSSYPDVFYKDKAYLFIGEAKASREDFEGSNQFDDYIKEMSSSKFHNKAIITILIVSTVKPLHEHIEITLKHKYPEFKNNIEVISIYE